MPNMQELLWEYSRNNTATHILANTDDQNFLWKDILPLARNNCLQHDSYYCSESGGIAFPITREESSSGSTFDYVGNTFNRVEGGNVTMDAFMSRDDMVKRYMRCLERRDNFTKFLEKTTGSSKILPGTPYKGRSDKSPNAMFALAKQRSERQRLARYRKKMRRNRSQKS